MVERFIVKVTNARIEAFEDNPVIDLMGHFDFLDVDVLLWRGLIGGEAWLDTEERVVVCTH